MAGADGLDVQVGGAFGRVGDQPLGVVIGGGVGVVGVQVEVHAGVAEVVLQPPPRTHPVDDLRRAQVSAGGEHVHLAQGVLLRVPPGDLPHREHTAVVVDGDFHDRVGQVPGVLASGLTDVAFVGELLGGQVGDGALAVSYTHLTLP